MAKQNKIFISALVAVVAVAFLLRWWQMPSRLFFGPEQGRDMLAVKNIVIQHDLTLVGSKTDIDGIMHGPIYYYIAAIPFAASRGNPVVVFGFLVLLQAISSMLSYQFAFELTGRKKTAWIAAIVFTFSFLAVVYARWFSNPPLSIPLSLLFGISILRFLSGKQGYLVVSAGLFGLLGQAEFINFLVYGIVVLWMGLFYFKKFLETSFIIRLASFFSLLTFSMGTYFLFDVRHNFLLLRSMARVLKGDMGFRISWWESITGYLRLFWQQIGLLVGSELVIIGAILFFASCFTLVQAIKKDKKYAFVFGFLLLPTVCFILLRHPPLEQVYAGTISFLLISISLLIARLGGESIARIALIVCMVILSNLFALKNNLPKSEYVFFQGQQPYVRFEDQLKVIDWIYTHASGAPFSFQAYTIPYFWQDAWEYLFWYHGSSRYGYLPDNQGRKLMFVAIQRDGLDSLFQKRWREDTVSKWGVLTDTTTIGEYTVELRVVQ